MKRGGFAISLIVVAFTLLVGMNEQSANIVSADESAWFRAQTPGLETFLDRAPSLRSDYNSDCVPETGVIRPAGFVPPATTPFTEQTTQGCAVRGSGGRFLNGFYKRDGTNLYASLGEAAKPIPGSHSALRFTNGNSQSSNAYLIPNFASLLKPVKLNDGKLRYDLNAYAPVHLRDSTGSLLNVDHNSVSFSPNGQWLIASTFQGMLRFNIDTHEHLLFDAPLNYQSGIAPLVQSAITNDGRYAVIASGPFSRFRIYDLQNCPTINQTTLGRRDCQFREMISLFPLKTGDHVSFQEVRFLSENALRVYRREQFGATAKTNQYLVLAPGTNLPHFEYLALGDSYTAGEGAYQYRVGTNTDINRCRNSEISYPYLIKEQLEMIQAESVACAGAKTTDINNNNPDYKGQVKDGLTLAQRSLPPILQSFSPGYLPQKLFVDELLPDVVTVSIGGNDIGFGDKLRACLAPGTCFATYEDRFEVFQEINDKFDDFVSTYNTVKAANRPTARIYAIGYPEIALPEGSCGHNVLLNKAELEFAKELITYLNDVLRRAAEKAGLSYLDVTKAFEGHRLCETVYSNIAVNGLTAGHDAIDWGLFNGPIAGESFHPNALGHRLYMQSILGQTGDFKNSATSPAGNPSNPVIDPGHQALQVPKTNRQTRRLYHSAHLAPDFVTKGKPVSVSLDRLERSLMPLSSFEISVGGQAVTVLSDGAGNISTTFSLNPNLSTGLTTFSVQGQNLAGENIKLYKTVYITASDNDLDGDGLENSVDSCPVLSGQTDDADQDGIDDACDGQISEPPLPVEPPVETPVADEPPALQTSLSASSTPAVAVSNQKSTEPVLAQTLIAQDPSSYRQVLSATEHKKIVTQRPATRKFVRERHIKPNPKTRHSKRWLPVIAAAIFALLVLGLRAYRDLRPRIR